ncbi:MAG: helix-turn-helix transcriptional regulator [Verrucomicrobia bacterium]|nr:helix-turn-helix transcriptional regulator [Verrucomicrobiota bacterium]
MNVQSLTTDEQTLILDPWSYDRSPGTEVVQHARRNLYPSHPYKLEELSKLVGYHPVHIARTFREFTGKTIGEFVRCARLDRARTLLADNRLSIAEIAQMAGFTDQSHLNRLFRRCYNLTPQEVRRMQKD